MCANVRLEPELPAVLAEAGLPADRWQELLNAVRGGADEAALTSLLDDVEEAAAGLGIDGVTTGSRQFRPLPASTAGVRTVHAWRCPHPHPCGHVQVMPSSAKPVCLLTEDPLKPVTVVSQ